MDFRYRYDTETGLYYLQSRYYNPEWGRFVNADGIVGTPGELLSTNMFAYCANNPVNNEDPDGQFWGALIAGIGAVVALPEEVVAVITVVAIAAVVLTVVAIVDVAVQEYRNSHVHYSSNSGGNAIASTGGRDVTGLPNQGAVQGDVPGSPQVDAGSQKKHVPTHKGSISTKTQWPVGENGVNLTQEGWQNGIPVKDTPNEEVRVWDTGRVIGANGETRVKVHMKKKTGMIHGYPVP